MGAKRRFHLSDREREVFRLLAEGKRDNQIARALGICERTVSTAVFRGCDILGAKTKCQAVAMLIEEKLKDIY